MPPSKSDMLFMFPSSHLTVTDTIHHLTPIKTLLILQPETGAVSSLSQGTQPGAGEKVKPVTQKMMIIFLIVKEIITTFKDFSYV